MALILLWLLGVPGVIILLLFLLGVGHCARAPAGRLRCVDRFVALPVQRLRPDDLLRHLDVGILAP